MTCAFGVAPSHMPLVWHHHVTSSVSLWCDVMHHLLYVTSHLPWVLRHCMCRCVTMHTMSSNMWPHFNVTCAFSAAFTLSFWCYTSSHAPLVLAKSPGCEGLVSSAGLNQMSGFLAVARTDHLQPLLCRWVSVVFDRSCHSWPQKTSSWPWSSLAETGRYVRCKQFSSLGQRCVYNITLLDLCT